MQRALAAFLAVLDATKVADIVRDRAALLPRLGLDDEDRPLNPRAAA